jgi:hypothetical protein
MVKAVAAAVLNIGFGSLKVLALACGTILYACGMSGRVLFRIGQDVRPASLRVTLAQEEEVTSRVFVS